MVRALLAAALLALLACQMPAPRATTTTATAAETMSVSAAAQHGHSGVACAACHRGKRADVGRRSVPREACTASGCHDDAGPPEVTLATAKFEHRNHGLKTGITLNCAGCHTHDTGDAPLRASLDACALCHTRDLKGTKADDCRLCHGQPNHKSLTSQGVPINHAALPFRETGCARCHYDVLKSQTKVALEKCANCHARTPEITRAGIAKDLHPSHRGVQCTSCHEAGLHRIGAMSSAVNLQCADCHDRAHEQPVVAWGHTDTCGACHHTVHAAQQRLVLGLVGDQPVLPSAKFLLGLTCRSCHVPPGSMANVTAARRGQGAACKACHEPEYARVLGWWLEGTRAREQQIAAYVHAGQRDLGNAPDTSRALLASADSMLALVRIAGGQHNLELSDLIFRTALGNAATAYRLGGRAAPRVPVLGNTPHVGTCSFCHYSADDKWNYQAVPLGLHERLIQTRK